MARDSHIALPALPAWLLIAAALSLLSAGCGGAASGQGSSARPDSGATPAYDAFLRSLRAEGVPAQSLGARPVNGLWTTADAVAAKGCQCAESWATLYIEHRLRVHGQIVVVDEELQAGAAEGAAGQQRHRYRLDNLLISTAASDTRLLGVLNRLSGARTAE